MYKKWLSWAVLILGVILLVRVGGNVMRLRKAGNMVEETATEVKKAEKENEDLQKKLSEVQTPEYMEREAREKLGYGKPGEIVLVMPNEDAPPSSKASEGLRPNWLVWRKLYFGF
jgi:cell division protein FtsB